MGSSRDIRELGCSEEFSERNFALAKYKDRQGKLRESYEMTKDGFTLLVMGYTGDKAMRKVEELALEEGFGGLAKTATPTYNPDGSVKLKSLPKKRGLVRSPKRRPSITIEGKI